MRKLPLLIGAVLVLVGCASESAMPLGNDMMKIDISAAPVYGRSGANKIALKKAAQATIESGYDRFIVLGAGDWNEQTVNAGSQSNYNASYNANMNANYYNGYGTANGNASGYANGSQSSHFNTFRHPESSIVIKMLRNKDKGASKAVDARKILEGYTTALPIFGD